MKILSATQIREADNYTIQHEPISSEALMERAAGKCFEKIKELYPKANHFTIYCGPGNNGGDGRIIGSRFKVQDSKFTISYPVPGTKYSVPDTGIIIDAMFGTGLNRGLEGWYAEAVNKINESGLPVVSIDIPSGLFADDNTGNDLCCVVKATHTLTFQCPKLAMMLPGTGEYCGKVHVLDIGLSEEYISSVKTQYYFTDKKVVLEIYDPREKFSNKGTYGHALLIAGSGGMMGAAVLAARAALHSGVGKLTVQVPESGREIMQTAVPEAMIQLAVGSGQLPFKAIGIGPGIGKSTETTMQLKLIIQQLPSAHSSLPTNLLIDADALNILSENKTWLGFLPSNTILTPHPKEFARLFGEEKDSLKRLDLLKASAVKYRCVIVLKGAHTAIALPDGTVWFNSTGNPGLAKGGSGDVLSGIIMALLAQGYPSSQAAILGVYLHGSAADIAVKNSSEEALTPSDVIENLGKAFKALRI